MINKDNNSSAALEVLLAFVPYTNQNLKLTFHPTQFFDELERSTDFSRTTLQQSYARLKTRGLIASDKVPSLTVKGRRAVQPYVAKELGGGAQLMVIFDIPEDFGEQRRQLRNLLKQLGFTQAQRSVWMSGDDHVVILREAIDEFKLGNWVEVYEVIKIN